jgi:hypothetical protein
MHFNGLSPAIQYALQFIGSTCTHTHTLTRTHAHTHAHSIWRYTDRTWKVARKIVPLMPFLFLTRPRDSAVCGCVTIMCHSIAKELCYATTWQYCVWSRNNTVSQYKTQNCVTRPRDSTVCGRVTILCHSITHRTVLRDHVIDAEVQCKNN